MRDDTILVNSFLRPFHHNNKLNINNIQCWWLQLQVEREWIELSLDPNEYTMKGKFD